MAHASISSNLAFLKRVPLFYGLHESALERLATSSTRRSFGKGKVVVKEGEQASITTRLDEREYGVSLKFMPRLMSDGRIELKVAPEVSELSRDSLVTCA